MYNKVPYIISYLINMRIKKLEQNRVYFTRWPCISDLIPIEHF